MFNNLTPKAEDLWFLPLGGTGEIGMNMNLFGHNGQWLMVDCGATFQAPLEQAEDANPNAKAYDVVSADPSFIEDRQHLLVGIVLTHAHEDHIGAIPALIERFRCPIYATSFTAEVLRRKLYRVDKAYLANIVIVEPRCPIQIGEFNIEWLNITHSIPDTNALMIRTPLGNIFHTADWKKDAAPVLGRPFNTELFKQLAKDKPVAMICDSTNADKAGYTTSEAACFQGLLNTIKTQNKRVVVTCFGSNLARLVTLAKIANETGRYMAVLGPALENMISIARSQGLWPDDLKIANSRHIGYLPREEVLIVATGSQGEIHSALGKLSRNVHPKCNLERGDAVIFSSMVIPGNEEKVERFIHSLKEQDIAVYTSENTADTLHASGHPSQQDLFDMYQLISPQIAIPTHGEAMHLACNADVAASAGISKKMLGKNGDLYRIKPMSSIHRGMVKAGRIDITGQT